MANSEMANMPDYYPQRGDQVEAWLEDFLKYRVNDGAVDGPASRAVMKLLKEYRDAADEMMSLNEVVNGRNDRPPVRAPKKKLKREA